MKEEFLDLPGWHFDIREVSMNVFKVECENVRSGIKVSLVGLEVEELVEECKKKAKEIESKNSKIIK